MSDAVISEAVPRPAGRPNGGLSRIPPAGLPAQVPAALAMPVGMDPAMVDDVIRAGFTRGESPWS
ncbi:hypothetical protein GCM10018780_89660 [Streptomyces lanatus]|nr:hypothetical protein GCM10018780_89660 [Streptomyces lanatus]